jgi:pentatricopeptide repeat protein
MLQDRRKLESTRLTFSVVGGYGAQRLESSVHGGVQADVISYSSAIDACARANRVDDALALLDHMKAKGVQPNQVRKG